MDLKERTLASPVHVSVTMPNTDDNAATLGKAAADLTDLWLGKYTAAFILSPNNTIKTSYQ